MLCFGAGKLMKMKLGGCAYRCSDVLLAFFPPSLSLVRKARQMLQSWICVKLLEKLKDALKVKEEMHHCSYFNFPPLLLILSLLFCIAY